MRNGKEDARLDHEVPDGPTIIVKIDILYLAYRAIGSLDMQADQLLQFVNDGLLQF